LRQAAGLTVRELAAYVGVDASTLHRWENGQFRPRGLTAALYEQALDVLAELLRRNGGTEFEGLP
jgi:transcriptional regulator with XRE-family HTH domain